VLTQETNDEACQRVKRSLGHVASIRVVPLPFLPLPCCIQAQSNIRLSARRAGGPTVIAVAARGPLGCASKGG